jgi:fructose-1,6-bisphosphatase/inositol monophosphatase family enzyme
LQPSKRKPVGAAPLSRKELHALHKERRFLEKSRARVRRLEAKAKALRAVAAAGASQVVSAKLKSATRDSAALIVKSRVFGGPLSRFVGGPLRVVCGPLRVPFESAL